MYMYEMHILFRFRDVNFCFVISRRDLRVKAGSRASLGHAEGRLL